MMLVSRQAGGRWPPLALALSRAIMLLVLLWAPSTAMAETPRFPVLSGPVVDEAGVLPVQDRNALRVNLNALAARTGTQIVVVTLKSLSGLAIEDYGVQLGRAWAIGAKGTNTGALLIVAPNEHAVRIEVGYGLEGTLTDAASRLIIEGAILPRFRANDIPGGVKAGVDGIGRILTADPGLSPSTPAPSTPAPSIQTPVGAVSIWPVLILGFGAVVVLIHCALRGGAFCRFLFQMLYMMALSGGGGGGGGGRASGNEPTYTGRGGSFGGGGASGRW